MAVWHQSNGANSFILANRFSIGTGMWGGAQTVGTALGNADPKMAVDASGNIAVVWYKLVNAKRFIFSNRFTPAGGLGRTRATRNAHWRRCAPADDCDGSQRQCHCRLAAGG
jgi:hypothetical protein